MSVASPHSDSLLTLVDRRVAVLRKQRPELDDALVLQQRILSTQLSAPRPPELSAFPLPRQQVAARLHEGVPLLHEQPAVVDTRFAADLFARLVTALRPRFDALADLLNPGGLDPDGLFGEAFVQHADHLGELARTAACDVDLLSAAAALAVAPLLRGYAARLTPLLAQLDVHSPGAEGWSRGYCPICGAWPLLGELRGVDLIAWLRCSACGSGWQVRSGACPFCDNADHQLLGTLTLEGESRFRAVVCQRCKTYLKVGNALEPPPAEVLALDDVVSLHLDLAAAERGYHRPSGTGYRIELAVSDAEWIEELA
jgi:FdhE protein